MCKITEVFFNWQLLLISFCVFIVLSTVKRVGTKKKGDKKIVGGFAHTKVWKMLQPVLPYPVAIGLCFIPGAPLPEAVTGTLAVKIMFGLVAGFLSDKSFQVVKNVLERTGVKFPEKE